MAFADANRDSMEQVDWMLRQEATFREIPLTLAGYKRWYALTLGALVTVAGSEDIVFARARYDADQDSAQLMVFTETLLTKIDVAGASLGDAEVTTRTIARCTLRALGLEITERHDEIVLASDQNSGPACSNSHSSRRRKRMLSG